MSAPVSLSQLLSESSIESRGMDSLSVSGLSYDSRFTKKGDLFFAIKGVHSDGHAFVETAAQKGAVAALVEKHVSGLLPTIQVPSVLKAMSRVSSAFFKNPSKRIPVIGITGTNGKTTTTYLIEDVMRQMNYVCGVMGTINYRIGDDVQPAPNTTPMSLDVQEFIARCAGKKAKAVAMEVSSHALELHRVDDVSFAAGVFTNLTQDHLDFHKTMENYFEAKAKLFRRPEKPRAVINIDDDYGAKLASELKEAITFGFGDSCRLKADNVESDLSGIRFKMRLPSGKSKTVETNLLGRHNVYNCLGAAGALLAIGFTEDAVVEGLNRAHAVPGRLERVEAGQKFVVTVDYAHTHDALSQVLTTLRNTGPSRLLCVFGAGGDRDKTKRPKMGDVATKLADFSFVTSDNPRTEDPKAILADIEQGILPSGRTNYTVIESREKAIEAAMNEAKPGDIVLIAGKGHEDYQIYGTQKTHFSDVEVAREKILAIGKS